MDDYILVDGELYHYGVKGMKWGVRREIGRKAQTAAYIESVNRSRQMKSQRLSVKMKRNKNKGKGYKNPELSIKKNELDRKTRKLEKLRNTLVKDLSPKDIERGRGSSFWMGFRGGFLGGPIGGLIAAGAYVMGNEHRIKKYEKEYTNRND